MRVVQGGEGLNFDDYEELVRIFLEESFASLRRQVNSLDVEELARGHYITEVNLGLLHDVRNTQESAHTEERCDSINLHLLAENRALSYNAESALRAYEQML